MFETGIRQFRMAMAMVNGRRIRPHLIQRLIADADATLREFGSPGDDVNQLLDGPFADPSTRIHFQTQGVRRTARRLAPESPFYAARFARSGFDPKKADLESITAVTADDEVRSRPHTPSQFVCRDAAPYLSTRTTGTTGTPTEIWLSRYEAELWPAMAALSGLLRNEINHSDCLQINLSSRATAAVQHDLEVCRLVGRPQPRPRSGPLSIRASTPCSTTPAPSHDPGHLPQLPRPTRHRRTSAWSWAERLRTCGASTSPANCSPTPSPTAARDTFGVYPSDTFAMTEVLPVSGRTCGHAISTSISTWASSK